jgi:hypothetical protein
MAWRERQGADAYAATAIFASPADVCCLTSLSHNSSVVATGGGLVEVTKVGR